MALILDTQLFFQNDIIDLSFVCNNGQIDNLLNQVEGYLFSHMFEVVGALTDPPQPELINLLKYWAFIEMMRNISNDFNGEYSNTYYSNILANNPTLAYEMASNREKQALQYAYDEAIRFNLDGWKLKKEYKKIVNYL